MGLDDLLKLLGTGQKVSGDTLKTMGMALFGYRLMNGAGKTPGWDWGIVTAVVIVAVGQVMSTFGSRIQTQAFVAEAKAEVKADVKAVAKDVVKTVDVTEGVEVSPEVAKIATAPVEVKP